MLAPAALWKVQDHTCTMPREHTHTAHRYSFIQHAWIYILLCLHTIHTARADTDDTFTLHTLIVMPRVHAHTTSIYTYTMHSHSTYTNSPHRIPEEVLKLYLWWELLWRVPASWGKPTSGKKITYLTGHLCRRQGRLSVEESIFLFL